MMDQVLSSIVLILACFLIYQAVIRSGFPRHPGDRNARK
jgi:CBS-domain-containing membrane protein